MKTPHTTSGFILAMLVVYGAIFLTIGLGLVGYLLELQKAESIRVGKEKAFTIAEAGVDYYAWHLAHFPTDLEDGTGAAGPYVHSYQDPEGSTVGQYSLSVNGNFMCNQPTSVDITSVGTSNDDPTHPATVIARYARQSVASYSYILNSAVWAGPTRTILGRYHSNYGIRMDANQQSTVESSVATWTCDANFGCSPTKTVNGVFGSGTNPALWSFPVPQIDFAAISVNLATLKTAAQSGGGLYFAPASGAQNQRGYHLIFNADGTVTVKRVTATTAIWGSNDGGATWAQEYDVIASETTLGTYAIPTSCSVVFVEDRAWVEGTVSAKVTVAAADLTGGGYTPDAYLPNNINYSVNDGSVGLTLVASGNILIPINAPDTMSLHGIFIAQNGHYGRNYYTSSGTHKVPNAYLGGIVQTLLTTVGTIVSNSRTGTAWIDGSGNVVSGYQTRSDSYDGNLATAPPPFTPYTSNQFNFVRWRQQ